MRITPQPSQIISLLSMAQTLKPSLRFTNNTDVPAIISLLLTSFRAFPLFDFLYTPLRTDKDNAFDTVFYWSRRVKLAISDPSSSVLVAEIPPGEVESLASWENREIGDEDAWKMLDWARTRGGLDQVVSERGTIIVGFSIWRWRDLGKLNIPQAAVAETRQWAIVRFIQSSFSK